MIKEKIVFKTLDIVFAKTMNPPILVNKLKKNVSKISDIVYDKDFIKDCKYDIYFSNKNVKKRPVIVIIHGGGFVAGDKKYREAQALFYANETDAFVVAVNYGLSPKTRAHEAVRNIINAINSIGNYEKDYDLDLSKIFVMGDSAGAYYAYEIGVFSSNEKYQRKLKVNLKYKICGLYLDCGLYYLSRIDQNSSFNNGIISSFCGCDFSSIKKYEYFNELIKEQKLNENFPRCFLCYSKNDMYCSGQTEMLIEELKRVGIQFDSYYSKVEKDNHCFELGWKNKRGYEVREKVLKFMKSCF